jgi:hypothetical protein
MAPRARYAFVRRSVSRFMPGERLEDALEAARTLQGQGAGAILRQLGENVADAAEAEQVTRHDLEVLDLDATLDLFRRARASSARVGVWITDTVAIRHILDHLGLSPPEEPPPDVRDVVRVPVDDQGREIGASPA